MYYGFKDARPERYHELRIAPRAEVYVNLAGPHVVSISGGYHTLITRDPFLEKGELFPLGGTRTVRGYRESRFYGQTIAYCRAEYRFLTGLRSRLLLFADAGAADSSALFEHVRSHDVLVGYGMGIRIATRGNQAGIDLGFGRGDSFLEGKIHIRLRSNF